MQARTGVGCHRKSHAASLAAQRTHAQRGARARLPVVRSPWCLVAACAALGCGVYDYDLGSSPAASGAGPDLGPPFSAPVLIAELSDPEEHDDDPALSENLLQIYFSSRREGGLGVGDIWYSERASVDDAWEPPTAVEELNSEQDETTVALAPDGLTIWISSDRDGGLGGTDVWAATRSSQSSNWGPLELVEAISTAEDEIVRGITPAGDLLLAWREDVEDTPFDLYIARRDGDSFLPPEPIAELNTTDNEADAFLATDNRVLYYTTDAAGEDDLVVAVRTDPDSPFVLVRALDELNSDSADRDPWVSSDQRFIVFASRRENDQSDLYLATR
jgi:hypothetical protein